jgi:hypothetical protein
MSELNKTTVGRFMALAGLKQKSEPTTLLKEATFTVNVEDPPSLADVATTTDIATATDTATAALANVDTATTDLANVGTAATDATVDVDLDNPQATAATSMTAESLERTNSLKIMSENQEKIVDKIADVMLKYLSDK